ncbi:MAG TPA: hypothetical protein DCE12_01845 [Gammaproteobacteria bacterium]|nr:hypothetical protein [Gammaproteobacteria bacterium]HAF73754.1 hypothetical protein [Gammaproteobacteria bacterium]
MRRHFRSYSPWQGRSPFERSASDAEMISYPNTKLMCSVNVDGSAAAAPTPGNSDQCILEDSYR